MTPFEKHAWFNLVVFVTAVVLMAPLAVLTEGYLFLVPLALLGLWTLGPIFYQQESKIDERTLAIQRQAVRIAIWCYWLLFIGTGLLSWLIFRTQDAISPTIIPMMILGGFALFVLVHAGATIVLHRLENWYAGS